MGRPERRCNPRPRSGRARSTAATQRGIGVRAHPSAKRRLQAVVLASEDSSRLAAAAASHAATEARSRDAEEFDGQSAFQRIAPLRLAAGLNRDELIGGFQSHCRPSRCPGCDSSAMTAQSPLQQTLASPKSPVPHAPVHEAVANSAVANPGVANSAPGCVPGAHKCVEDYARRSVNYSCTISIGEYVDGWEIDGRCQAAWRGSPA